MHNIEIQTTAPTLNLLLCAVDIKQASPEANRDVIAKIVREHNYTAHVGGHHVGIMDGRIRLAMVTSGAPDFN